MIIFCIIIRIIITLVVIICHNLYYNSSGIIDICNHNFDCDKKNIPELLQYRSGRHKNDTPEMALQSYTQINVQSARDPNIFKKVRIWGRVNFAENAVKGGHE